MAIDFEGIFVRIPLLKHLSPADFDISLLSGLSNLNYRLFNRNSDYVLRVPRSKTSGYIDREAEAFNIDQAMRADLAPKLLWSDNSGLSLTQCITHSRALTPDDFRDNAMLSLLVGRLGVLHNSGLKFQAGIDLTELLNRLYGLLSDDHSLELGACFEQAQITYRELVEQDRRVVPSHNDLVLENLLIDRQGKLWMIDWEYSAMASPYWDLATLCNAARLNSEGCRELLALYDDTVMPLDFECLRAYQYILQVLTVGWMSVFSPESLDREKNWLDRLHSR